MDVRMQELSSEWTFFRKFVGPILIIVPFIVGLHEFVLHAQGHELSNPAKWLLVPAIALAFGLYQHRNICLKKIALGGDTLIISNYRRSIIVSLNDVEEVYPAFGMAPELIWIRFRRSTEFGRKIVFLPPLRWPKGVGPHPVLANLQQQVVSSERPASSRGIGPKPGPSSEPQRGGRN